MTTVENKTSAGETITLDDKHFVNCKFERCTILYSGGDFTFTNTSLKECPVTLTGPAQRTAYLLGTIGALKPGGFIPALPWNVSPKVN